MSNLKPQVQHAMQCTSGESCTRRAPGHGISPMQLLASGATPGQWRDAFVAEVQPEGAGGWIALELFGPDDDSGAPRAWLWSHAAPQLAVGTPVALHALYSTLAVGSARISVVVAAAL